MPVIGIHFLDYEQFSGYPDRHLCFELREGQHPELRFSRDLVLHLFELPKLERQGQPASWGDPLWEWLHFFNHAHEEDENMRTQYTNALIHKAFDLLETLSADDLTRQRAEIREKALKNERALLEEARMEGLTEGMNLGELIGAIRALQQVLKRPVQDKETLMRVSCDELQTMLRQLEADLQAGFGRTDQ